MPTNPQSPIAALRECEALLAKATPGEWFAWDRGCDVLGCHLALDPEGDDFLPSGMRADLTMKDAIAIAATVNTLRAHLPTILAALELAEREPEVSVAQAVEFAECVERQAKGAMVEAARKFLSVPYAQELRAKLRLAERVAGAPAEEVFTDDYGDVYVYVPDALRKCQRVALLPITDDASSGGGE